MTGLQSRAQTVFQERFEQLAGKVHRAETPAEAVQLLASLLVEKRIERVAKTRLPGEVDRELLPILNRLSISAVGVGAQSDLVEEVSRVGAGITMAHLGIAETGTLVEVTHDDGARLVSSLPPIHVALVYSQDILPSFAEAIARIRQRYSHQENNYTVTFISGPSRTADIEMTLVLGVHGPHEVHAIVADWPGGW